MLLKKNLISIPMKIKAKILQKIIVITLNPEHYIYKKKKFNL